MNEQGFTLVEMIVAVLILTSAVLGMGASAGYMLQAAAGSGVRSEALQAVEGRISQIVMDPRYEVLDSLYDGVEANLPGLEGFERTTKVTHVTKAGEGQLYIDYKEVNVSVSGPSLKKAMSRTIIVGSP